MQVVVIGRSGQLASEILRCCPKVYSAIAFGRDQIDILSGADSVIEKLYSYSPDLVINAAAYTAVDKAETDVEAAYAVNAHGVRNLAVACRELGSRIFHVSTDFVFGEYPSTVCSDVKPIGTDAIARPRGVYAASKFDGEQSIREISPDNSVVVRTSWLYSNHGHNFVKTILRLLDEKSDLGIVADQVGSPTWAKGLAVWLWRIAREKDVSGIFHWTDAGVASWYDFACAIQDLGLEKGLLNNRIPINPITTAEYPTPAFRPGYSVLDNSTAEAVSGLRARNWREQLSLMLDELVLP